MKAKLATRYLSEADYPAWNRLVAQAPAGSIYSTPEYLETLCQATGGEFRILALERSGELMGGVALYEEHSRFGTIVSPRLLLQYNGIVLSHGETGYPSQRTALHLEQLVALERALAETGYASLSLKCRHPLNDVRVFLQAGWTVRPSYTYEVDISDVQAAWKRVEQNLRRLIKRCEGQGLRVSEDGDFESFYRMHRQTHERKGAALYLPQPRFEGYFERLRAQGLCSLFHARLPEGRSIAAQLVLTSQHAVTHTVSAAADADYLNVGASAFLRWKVMERLSQRHVAANDLTDAALNPVTHFKAQLGGDLRLCLVLMRPSGWRLRAATATSGLLRRGRALVASLARPKETTE